MIIEECFYKMDVKSYVEYQNNKINDIKVFEVSEIEIFFIQRLYIS